MSKVKQTNRRPGGGSAERRPTKEGCIGGRARLCRAGICHAFDAANPESRTTFPSRISTRRDAARATSSLWVTTINVVNRSARDLPQQPHHGRRGMGVEIAGWLIRDQESRPVDQRPRDRRPLLLAAAELMNEVSRSIR